MTTPYEALTGRLSRRAVTSAGLAATFALGASPAFGRAGRPAARHGRPPRLDESLHASVRGYSQYGVHRTGTPSQERALEWLEQELKRRGGRVGSWSYDFPFYDWHADVRVGQHRVDTVPLYFEGEGRFSGRADFVRSVTTKLDGNDPAVLGALADARAANARLAVLATNAALGTNPLYDGLIGYNSDPDLPKTGVPTLLVPGRVANDLAAYGAEVEFSARTITRRTRVVTAWFGTRKPVVDPVIVTTPLTGWFNCAAERATGLAVALELATDLAQDQPVLFVGNTAHELYNYGASRYLAEEFDLEPRAVFHLGSAIGATRRQPDGSLVLGPRAAYSQPANATVPDLVDDLKTANIGVAAKWPGEGQVWHDRLGDGVPLLSVAGNFREFHSPDDVVSVSTDPATLRQAYDAIRAGVGDLLAFTA
ncbi:hypothetical protein ASC77_20950 [Nocardioides sp. Root1257]|uniref:hypothetical protein n=1 Tax=unclassified Nocardioides TaxID=2615069 RepID=UPI0006FB9F97|nr:MULTISPECIES: hypothetical protein [unclassified Nocardioides]KQW43874.1 hypothetical protein ASC77_20950 [Nocardioides sp. Root1257]KRC42315.1 hypothetical protein ASE24_20745 [Nocardioides sp. Root224]